VTAERSRSLIVDSVTARAKQLIGLKLSVGLRDGWAPTFGDRSSGLD
jgi:hypothetical protein